MIKYPQLLFFDFVKVELINVNICHPILPLITRVILGVVWNCHFIILFIFIYLLQILIKFFRQLWRFLGIVRSLYWAFLTRLICSDSLLSLLLISTSVNLLHNLWYKLRRLFSLGTLRFSIRRRWRFVTCWRKACQFEQSIA